MKRRNGKSANRSSRNLSRRDLMKGAAALATGTAASALASSALSSPAEAGPSAGSHAARSFAITASPGKNVVETDSGKVFGYLENGIVTFRGIPYGASTESENRFMPPVKPAPWTGVRSALLGAGEPAAHHQHARRAAQRLEA